MKKIIAISDTHGHHREMTNDLINLNLDNDNTIIVHSGDISMRGSLPEINDFLEWYSDLPFKHKIFIAGNHDFGFETMKVTDIAPEYKEKGVIYLMDQMVHIDGLKVYGSPWQPRFYDWAFNVDRGAAIAKKWEKIPEGLDILLTHGPAHGMLDTTWQGMAVGCEDLFNKIIEVKPKLHVFGHIHHSYGYKEFNGTSFANASSLDEGYRYRNKPIVFTLDENNNISDIDVDI